MSAKNEALHNDSSERRLLSWQRGETSRPRFRRSVPIDALSWVVAIFLATMLRFDFNMSAVDWGGAAWLALLAVVLQVLFAWLFYAYRGAHPWASFEGTLDLALVMVLVGAISFLAVLIWQVPFNVPRSVPVIATLLVLLLATGYRMLSRLLAGRRPRSSVKKTPVIIYGAGYVGDHLARLLTTDTETHLDPVAFLDDDPQKARFRRHSVPVVGELKDLPEVRLRTGAQTLIVAIGNPEKELLNRVQDAAGPLGMKVQVMPPTEEMLRSGVQTSGLRDLAVEDLLGRPVVDTNVSQIASYLNGKRVLVTGAGGSIGEQLCVEIQKHGPKKLILLDRDETGLQQAEIRVRGYGLFNTGGTVLADIRDKEALDAAFKEHQPEVVFHAAALKHLPALERYPDEAWKTNVQGTENVIEACQANGVKTLVNISTDKAANPTSILGLSKRLAERLVASAEMGDGCRFLSVRFGNVIGSRGSMLPTFYQLIEEGRDITVTHPDVTRYFMTIPEACQLVLQAGAIGRKGEVLILDMGEPVRILDIANKMISLSGKDLKVRFTGLREGEKLREDLHAANEAHDTPFHDKISHSSVNMIAVDGLTKDIWDALVVIDPDDRAAIAAESMQRLQEELVDSTPGNQAD